MLRGEVNDLPYEWANALRSFCYRLMGVEAEIHQLYLLAYTRAYLPNDWKQNYQIYLKAFTAARRDATDLWAKINGRPPADRSSEFSEQALREARALIPPTE
jgi:hypothetical protein